MDDKTRQVVFETNGKTYGELYWSLIEERRASPPPEGLGTEVHHVVPKSICPILKRSNENLVRLTDREHLVAHFLLWQHYKRETSERGWEAKMCTAFWRMVNTIEWRGVAKLEWLSERYEEARVDFSKTMSGESNPMKRPEMKEKFTGENNPMKKPEVRAKISEARRNWLRNNPDKNPMKRPEVRDKISKTIKERWNIPDIRSRYADAKKGERNPMKRPEVREKFTGENNPMKRHEVREKLYKKVVQCSPDGTFIAEYSSVTEAAHKTNSRKWGISLCCHGGQKTHNGFVWRLAAEPQAEEVSHG